MKPCPYCHSKAVKMVDEFVQYVYVAEQPEYANENKPFYLYHLSCDNCGISGAEKRTKKAATEAFYTHRVIA